MSHFTVAEAKSRFSDLLRRAEYRGERVIVQRHGKPVAAIVSTEDLRRLEALEDAADVASATAALQEAEAKGTIPLNVVLERYGLGYLASPSSRDRRRRPARTRPSSASAPTRSIVKRTVRKPRSK